MSRWFLCAGVVRLTLPSAVYAQSNYARLRGSVTDPQHHVIEHARVRITASATGTTRELATDGAGLFTADGLQPGAYQVEVSSAGFATSTETIQLEVGQQATLDEALAVGQHAEKVFVGANTELLKTADASVGEVVDRRSVQQLPLNGRQLLDLVSTVPGAHVSMGAQLCRSGSG